MKKLKILQITIIVLLIVFAFFFFKAVDYTKEYVVDNVNIVENFDKKNKYYYFTFTYKDTTFDYLVESKYKQKRNFIESVSIIEEEDNFCLIPEGHTFEFMPLCQENNKITYYQNVSDNLLNKIPEDYLTSKKEIEETFKDITIYNKDYTYLLWNYQGFYYINEDTEKEINFLETEQYNVPLISYTQDYLVIPNYDDEYTFDKFYRLSFQNGNLKEYKLDYKIYFDSYFPGYDKNKLYIVDNNEEVMYEWNAKNGDLEKIKPKMLNNNKWENVSIKTLIDQNKKFTYPSNYVYELSDGFLTMNYQNKDIKTLIDQDVTDIIRIKDNLVFYLKTDTVYVFNKEEGKSRLLYNFEWNFNYENMIYIN